VNNPPFLADCHLDLLRGNPEADFTEEIASKLTWQCSERHATEYPPRQFQDDIILDAALCNQPEAFASSAVTPDD
jgi:hypothetical protein